MRYLRKGKNTCNAYRTCTCCVSEGFNWLLEFEKKKIPSRPQLTSPYHIFSLSPPPGHAGRQYYTHTPCVNNILFPLPASPVSRTSVTGLLTSVLFSLQIMFHVGAMDRHLLQRTSNCFNRRLNYSISFLLLLYTIRVLS